MVCMAEIARPTACHDSIILYHPRTTFQYPTDMPILFDIISYAFRGRGKYILFTCMVLSIIAKLAGIAPLIGPIASILLGGYFCAVYFQLIQSTATGGKEAPDFPETSNIMEDIIWPMIQIIVVALVSFGPLIAYSIWANDLEYNPLIGYGLLGWGVIYFPMAILAVVVLGYTGALSPHIVIPAIFRAGLLYWMGVFLLLFLYMGQSIIASMLSGHLIIGSLLMSLIGAYALMTNARILGIVYREKQEELNWL